MPVIPDKKLDMKLMKLISIEINKITEDWIKRYEEIQKKYTEKNPFEFSIATINNFSALVTFITPEPVGLCIEIAHNCLKLNAKSYDELKREFGIDKKQNDYIG